MRDPFREVWSDRPLLALSVYSLGSSGSATDFGKTKKLIEKGKRRVIFIYINKTRCHYIRYETDNAATKFTEQQLAEIRKITLSKVLCENMDHPEEIQRSAFDQPSSFL